MQESTAPAGLVPTPVRIGIIGLVSSYSVLVADELMRLPGAVLVGATHMGRDDQYIADSLALQWLTRFPKSTAGYRETFGVPVFDSVEGLYDAGVDAVVLATEEYLRTRYAVDALKRGVHVYLPKPFAYTRADVARLRGALAQTTATAFPGLPHRWSAHYRRAAELLQPEALGTPLTMRAAITHHLSTGPWKSDPTLAAGPEFEMGFYPVDALLMLAGAVPRTVTGSAANLIHRGMPGFDFAKAQMEFAGGAQAAADFYCGIHYPFRGQEMEVVARDGGVWIGRGQDGATELHVYDRLGPRQEKPPALGRGAELAHWVDLCRRDDRDDAGHWFNQACATLSVLLAFKQSWEQRETVEVQPL